jgi:hypothetical protein
MDAANRLGKKRDLDAALLRGALERVGRFARRHIEAQRGDGGAEGREREMARAQPKEQAAEAAVSRRDMFNLLEVDTGDKVDFWTLKDTPFDRSRFSRRQAQKVFGFDLYVSTPEDTILQKLLWAKMSGGSARQYGDALGVFELQHATLDLRYVNHWAAQLGVVELWQKVQDEAERI